MADIPSQVINTASREGGALGLFFVLLLGFIVWYIHSSRKYHAIKDQAEASERKEWREALDRNTTAFHNLSQILHSRPCLRPHDARTRETDRGKKAE